MAFRSFSARRCALVSYCTLRSEAGEKSLDTAHKMRLASWQRRNTFTSTPAASCSRAHPVKFRSRAAESCETASLNLSALLPSPRRRGAPRTL